MARSPRYGNLPNDANMLNPLLPIRFHDLRLKRRHRRVLDNLNLLIKDPGITVIMGPNGAGKSLTLRCLHGLIKPDRGSIALGALSVADSQRQQAMVFQHPVLLRRNVMQNLAFAKPEADHRELIDALTAVNLDDRAEQPARLLSGGEQQRLALARALLNQPKLLLLDEATASLDPASVLLIESLIRKQSQAGTKVILISHDQGQARRLADDVVFICRGQVVEHRPADAFFSHPESREAQAYLTGDIIV